MEMKMWECERDQLSSSEEEHNNNNKEEDRIHTVVFTAGTFLLMVCLKRFLVEQWRAWVFLLLNLILLAILFMSMKPFHWAQKSESEESKVEEEEELVKSDKKAKGNNNPCGGSQDEYEETEQCCKNQCWSATGTNGEIEEEEEEEEEEHAAALSKEELNERVEAFIAMFRQHLISDVKQGESFRISKNANLTPNKIQVSCC